MASSSFSLRKGPFQAGASLASPSAILNLDRCWGFTTGALEGKLVDSPRSASLVYEHCGSIATAWCGRDCRSCMSPRNQLQKRLLVPCLDWPPVQRIGRGAWATHIFLAFGPMRSLADGIFGKSLQLLATGAFGIISSRANFLGGLLFCGRRSAWPNAQRQ